MAKKVLLTGAGGYIGSNGAYNLLQNGYEVVAVDDLSNGYKEPLELLQEKFGKEKFRYYVTSIETGIHKVFWEEKDITGVIHYAAPCSVNESMQNPGKYFNTVNIGLSLLKAMMENEVKNIVFSSTCAVYGEAEYVPVDEKHPTRPANPYGESKRMVEKMIEWFGEIKGLNYVILRYFNVCGASDDGLFGDSKKPSVHMMQNAIRGILGIEDFFLTCPKVETPDGTPIRDYTNVVDLNEGHIKALEYLWEGGKSDTINLGTGKGNSVLEIIKAVEDATGKKFPEFEQGPARQGEYATMIAATEKAEKVLGWKPKRFLADSAQSLVTWYTQHPHGWKE